MSIEQYPGAAGVLGEHEFGGFEHLQSARKLTSSRLPIGVATR